MNAHWSQPPKDDSWWWAIMILFFMIVLIGIVMYSCSARAHIKDRPDLDAWMNGLASKGGYPCCSDADASTIPDAEWDTAMVNGEIHYRVRLNGNWVVVSPEEVVEGPNKFGSAIAWIYLDSLGVPNVRCFMPGAGG